MKKVLAFILTLTLMMSITLTAWAAPVTRLNPDGSSSTGLPTLAAMQCTTTKPALSGMAICDGLLRDVMKANENATLPIHWTMTDRNDICLKSDSELYCNFRLLKDAEVTFCVTFIAREGDGVRALDYSTDNNARVYCELTEAADAAQKQYATVTLSMTAGEHSFHLFAPTGFDNTTIKSCDIYELAIYAPKGTAPTLEWELPAQYSAEKPTMTGTKLIDGAIKEVVTPKAGTTLPIHWNIEANNICLKSDSEVYSNFTLTEDTDVTVRVAYVARDGSASRGLDLCMDDEERIFCDLEKSADMRYLTATAHMKAGDHHISLLTPTGFDDTTIKSCDLYELTVYSAQPSQVFDPTNLDSYAPTGCLNLALSAQVDVSSSYEADGWGKANIKDGSLSTGWTTDPYPAGHAGAVTDPETITYTFADTYLATRAVVCPTSSGKGFPEDFKLETSVDNEVWTLAGSATGVVATEPYVINFAQPVKAKYMRLTVTKRDARLFDNGNYLVQLMEFAVFGYGEGGVKLELNKPALRMNPDENDQLNVVVSGGVTAPDMSWQSSDNTVVTVSDTGAVHSVGCGTATITGHDAVTNTDLVCSVTVENFDIHDKFMISAFWPPMVGYINDEQYDYLARAGFTNILNTTGGDVSDVASNLQMAKLASERGMDITVGISQWNNGFWASGLTEEQIADQVSIFSHVPGVGGYYIVDEPRNPNPYTPVYPVISSLVKGIDLHLNYTAPYYYGGYEQQAAQMLDYANLAGLDNVGYLMFDSYVFSGMGDYMMEGELAKILNNVRLAGLKSDKMTGFYVQSIGFNNTYRKTNENEIRYNVWMGVANGAKQVAYFCYWQPTNRSETFTSAIMDAEGHPTEIYEPVCKINSELKALGPTLMKLDSLQVYYTGAQGALPNELPADFFIQPADADDNLILSYMRDKTDGTNYCMMVNRDYKASHTVNFKIADGISGISAISKTTGEPVSCTVGADGSYQVDLLPGEGVLYQMPADYDYTPDFGAYEQVKDTNVALDAMVDGSSARGTDNFYLDFLTDGVRFSDMNTSAGWESAEGGTAQDQDAFVTVDLKYVQPINRVDLYPAGESLELGGWFPKDFTLEISADGESWTTVGSETDFVCPLVGTPSYKFTTTDARYVRVKITGMHSKAGQYKAQLGEIEVFNDTGLTPPPANCSFDLSEGVRGANAAQAATVIYSSTGGLEQDGWSYKYINDNNTAFGRGWTSGIGLHQQQDTDAEWIGYDLGGRFSINKVEMYPAGSNGESFPEAYVVEASEDGSVWREVASVTGDTKNTGDVRTVNFDSVETRYVRVRETRMSDNKGVNNDGYLFQLAELKVFGDALGDKTALDAAIKAADKLSATDYTADSWQELQDALNTAKTVYGYEVVEQIKLTIAEQMLKVATENLVKKPAEPVNKAALEAALTEAGKIDGRLYTTDSVRKMTEQLAKAKAVSEDVNATQDAVNAAVNNLNTAVANLKVPTYTYLDKGTLTAEGTISFRVDAPFGAFTGVAVDGAKLTRGTDYEAAEGSTIITLKKEYVAKLSSGEHKIAASFITANGEKSFEQVFTKAAANSNSTSASTASSSNSTTVPNTGDNSGVMLWLAVLCASLLGMAVIVIKKHKAVY